MARRAVAWVSSRLGAAMASAAMASATLQAAIERVLIMPVCKSNRRATESPCMAYDAARCSRATLAHFPLKSTQVAEITVQFAKCAILARVPFWQFVKMAKRPLQAIPVPLAKVVPRETLAISVPLHGIVTARLANCMPKLCNCKKRAKQHETETKPRERPKCHASISTRRATIARRSTCNGAAKPVQFQGFASVSKCDRLRFACQLGSKSYNDAAWRENSLAISMAYGDCLRKRRDCF